MHCALAPFGLLFSPVELVRDAIVGEGFGAGATVVFGTVEAELVLQAARARLYHLLQSVVVVEIAVVVFTAPADLPDEVCAAADLQAALLALPAFVQSYCRVVVLVVVAVVVVLAGTAAFEEVAGFAAAGTAPLQAALFALPAFEQS